MTFKKPNSIKTKLYQAVTTESGVEFVWKEQKLNEKFRPTPRHGFQIQITHIVG